MTRLEQGLQLRRLSQSLSNQSNDPEVQARRVMRALRCLMAGRPWLLKGLRTSLRLGLKLHGLHRKFRLWSAAAGDLNAASGNAVRVLHTLQNTDAWNQAGELLQQEATRRSQQLWNHRGRLTNADEVLNHIRQNHKAPLFFWHHYDQRGMLPRSWLAILKGLKAKGWCVVVSSSELNAKAKNELRQYGIVVLLRENIGLCLGAYRDFCCLLKELSNQVNEHQTLVLANDSTLPVGGVNAFINTLTSMKNEQDPTIAQLSGMTDSVERNLYHIQSYFLIGNANLINTSTWKNYWQEFSINGSKDDLIDRGELGLSQTLLRAGFTVKARFSLISMLLDDSTTNEDLARFEINEPRNINLSLYAWKSLLKKGCPLIKKQVIFNPTPCPEVPIPLSELKPYLETEYDNFRKDLEDLLQSRYLSP